MSTMPTSEDFNDILFEVNNNVAWITINRPKSQNAFREHTLDELIHAFKSTRNDPSIVCAVVTGAGNTSFSAGGDFGAMMKLNWANAYHWNDRMLGTAMTIRGLPIPVIAMVNGWCMGGGHELALWCDMVIASDNAMFGQTGAKVGACPTVARTFTAAEAVEIGLINKVVPQGELRRETEKWCESIKSHSGQTIRMTKKSLNHESDELYASWQHGMELLAHVWGTDEANEGMEAFLEKRKPDFMQFRMKNKQAVDTYLDDLNNNRNQYKPE